MFLTTKSGQIFKDIGLIILKRIIRLNQTDHWGIYDQNKDLVGTIYLNEISYLWYHFFDQYLGEIDVYPWYTILMSDGCYGHYQPPSTTPTMAIAFAENHASAFVGATITVPGASDTYMRAFWYNLCQGNYNVQHTTITLYNTYDRDWNLSDEWRIYGNLMLHFHRC